MRPHKILSAAIAAVAITLGSCSNIDEDERLIEVDTPQANRAVLIEDFTGQWCPNCPNASDEIESLTQTYGSDKIIAVAIHCGAQRLQGGTDDMPGLKTDLCQEYYDRFGIEYQPQGKVDRGGSQAYTDWYPASAADCRSQPLSTSMWRTAMQATHASSASRLTWKASKALTT